MQVSYVKSGYEIITNYNNSKDVDMQFEQQSMDEQVPHCLDLFDWWWPVFQEGL